MKKRKIILVIFTIFLILSIFGCKNPSDNVAVKKYTVTFMRYHGIDSGGEKSVEVEEGKLISKPKNPEYMGYIFKGWYKEKDLITEWDFSADKVTKNITLYAKWEKREYKVTFDGRGGTPVPETQIVKYNEKVKKPTSLPTKAGYDFEGWYYKSPRFPVKKWDFDKDTVIEDMTIVAMWEKEKFEVTFETNGGDPTPETQKCRAGELVDEPTSPPTKDGYVFKGWYKEPEFTTKWDFEKDKVSGKMTLYAKWNPLYKVSFDSNGGEPAPELQEVESSELASEPPEPTKEGYVFKGWYRDPECTTKWDFSADKVTKNITLYAKWNPLYKVSFDSNGGEPTPELQEVESNELASEPLEPTKEGYVFKGWYQDPALTTKWSFTEDRVLDDITLYAKWNPACKVSFNTNGGIMDSSVQYVEYNTYMTPPKEPTRDDDKFLGWFTDEDCTDGNEFDFNTTLIINNITLYAKWGTPCIKDVNLYYPKGIKTPYLKIVGENFTPENVKKIKIFMEEGKKPSFSKILIEDNSTICYFTDFVYGTIYDKKAKTLFIEYKEEKIKIILYCYDVDKGALIKCEPDPRIPYEFKIPEGIEVLKVTSFTDTYRISVPKIIFPKGLKKIEESVFEKASITEVVFNEELSEIEEKAFYYAAVNVFNIYGNALVKLGKKGITSRYSDVKIKIHNVSTAEFNRIKGLIKDNATHLTDDNFEHVQ